MSTDDLTARARAEVRTLDAVPEAAYTSALLSELAGEVDRLRGLRGRFEAQCAATRKQNDRAARAEAERDAARAALERVRAERAQHPVCDVHPEDDSAACGWKRTVIDIDEALEGKP